MAIQTWYFDSVNGSDSNGGHSPNNALQNYSTFNTGLTGLGDILLFKRGTTQTISVVGGKSVRSGASDTVRARYGAYGEAQVPYSIWKYGAAGGNTILTAARSSYIDFEDMYFDMRNTNCRTSIYFASQSTFPTTSNAIRRCYFQGSNTPVIGGGCGMSIQREDSATVWPTNYVVEDCEFFDNEGHGLFIKGSQNMIVRRCRFYRNGSASPTGGHGFSAGTNLTAASSGWTNTNGTIWQRTLTGTEATILYVKTDVAAYTRLRLTGGTQTSPGAGEFGLSGGVLYINVNSASNPSGQGVYYVWGKCSGLIVEDCESHDNIWYRAAAYQEGHGFAFDDYSDDSIFRRNKSYNNEGSGFSINRGDRNTLFANIAYGNQQAGVVASPCDGLKIFNNVFRGNNTGTQTYTGEIATNGYCRDFVISNNILLPTVSYGISRQVTDTGFTGTKNCIYGHTVAPEKYSSVSATVSVDPQLDGNYRPRAAALIRAGANLGGKDFYGKQFYSAPNMGAVEDGTATPRYTFRA